MMGMQEQVKSQTAHEVGPLPTLTWNYMLHSRALVAPTSSGPTLLVLCVTSVTENGFKRNAKLWDSAVQSSISDSSGRLNCASLCESSRGPRPYLPRRLIVWARSAAELADELNMIVLSNSAPEAIKSTTPSVMVVFSGQVLVVVAISVHGRKSC